MFRVDQTDTLGSREVCTSRSKLDRVEALIDSIADSLNYHGPEMSDAEREKIIQGFDN